MPFSGSGPADMQADFTIEGDAAAAARAADRVADAISKVLVDAFKKLGGQLDAAMRKAVHEAFDPSQVDRFANSVNQATLKTRTYETEIKQLQGDFAALDARVEATRKTLKKAGAEPGLFAGVERQMEGILALQRTIDQQADRLAIDPAAVKHLQLQYDTIRTTISRDIAGIQSVLKSFTTHQRQELIRQTSDASHASRERTASIKAASSQLIVAQQHEGAVLLNQQRSDNALRLNAERAHARSRIELVRFTLRQITSLEKTVGKLFSGTAGVIRTALARVESSTQRMSRSLRGANQDMVQGLQPALASRERSISRSFHSQETVVRSSVLRQERLLAQLNTQASRGVTGAVTGRSGLGALLGGGVAIGGTFALISKLKQGFQESVNLNESLNKTRQIFGSASDEIIAFAENSVDALFVTRSAALEAASNFGIFGKSAGLAGTDLSAFSKRLVVLATDLASFNNTSIDDATTAIAAALRGESEPIRKYGVLLNEAVLQNRAFSEGIVDTIRKLTPQERVLAANLEILAQTTVQQGDAARTADQFANSSRRARAASIEFFASIAKFAVPLATLITNGILPVFRTLTDLVNNDVGPGLKILRDGLIGAGTALAGLLAFKVVGEVLQFLAVGIKAVLTPMGLVITAVTLFGAAFKILSERSAGFRRFVEDLREAFDQRLRQGLDLAREVLARIGAVIVDTVVPAAVALATIVRDQLLRAFNATVGFVRDTVIPAFERFGRFLRDDVYPILVNVATILRERLARGFEVALDAVRRFFDFVRPLLEPIVEGFRQLGDQISETFELLQSADFSGALARLRSFGSEAMIVAGAIGVGLVAALINPVLGIGVTIAGLAGFAFGPSLLNAVRPQLKRFTDFLKRVFSPRNLGDLAGSFLAIVKRIGKIVGSIVSDRRFVTGLAAIVAAFAATAGAFVLGFAEGVADNVPELIRLVGNSLLTVFTEAFKFAVSNPTAILKVLAALFVGAKLLSIFKRSGAEGSKGFIGGFTSGLKTGAFNNAQFFRGFFGDPNAIAAKSAADFGKAVKREFQAVNRDLVRLGQSASPALQGRNALGQFTGITEESLTRANAKLDETRQRLGANVAAGRIFRAELGEAFKGARVAASGFADILKRDVEGGFKKIRTGARTFSVALKDAFQDARANFQATGISAGQAIGGAILSGVGAALSGQALGNATSKGGAALGLAGIVSSALFAGAAVGGGAQGVLVGTIVAGLGLVTAAVTESGRAGRAAKERIQGYVDALRDIDDVLGRLDFNKQTVIDRLLAFSPETLRLLDEAGFSMNSLATGIADGTLDAKDLEGRLKAAGESSLAGWGDVKVAVAEVTSVLDDLGAAARQVDLAESMGLEGNDLRALGAGRQEIEGIADALAGLKPPVIDANDIFTGDQIDLEALITERDRRVLEDTRIAIDDVESAIDSLNDARTDRINARIAELETQLGSAQEAANLAKEAVASFFSGGFSETTQAALDNLTNNIPSLGQAFGEAEKLGGEAGAAALRTARNNFEQELDAIAARAFEEDQTIDTAGLLAKFQPSFDAIREAAALDKEDLFTDETAQGMIDIIQGKLSDGGFQAAVDFAAEAQTAIDDLQIKLNEQRVTLETNLVFSPTQITNALADALGVSFDEAASILDLSGRLDQLNRVTSRVGTAVAEGVAGGVEAGTPLVTNAVQTLSAASVAIIRKELGITSPSRVFEEIGKEIPAGLTKGILDGGRSTSSAVRVLGDAVVKALDGTDATLSPVLDLGLDSADDLGSFGSSLADFIRATFDAVKALEGLAGVDLSKIGVGAIEGANPLSNAGRVAQQFADALAALFGVLKPLALTTPVLTPAPVDLPPNPLVRSDGVNISEGAVANIAAVAAEAAVAAARQTEAAPKVVIEHLEIKESTDARRSAREAVMAMTAASLGA